jgi:CRP/FNR family cyclic AMP-dependent transcriptional regulator
VNFYFFFLNFGKEEKPETMIAIISRKMLAEMIGTNRSHLSFPMNKLGFIEYKSGIEVHSFLLHIALHDQPLDKD